MPSLNGGGPTSRWSVPPGAGGVLAPSAPSRTTPDSSRAKAGATNQGPGARERLRTTQLHHSLDLAEPHGLEYLEALSDHAGHVQRHGVAGGGVGGEVVVERLAGDRDHFGFEGSRGGESESIGRSHSRPSDSLSGGALFDEDILFAVT